MARRGAGLAALLVAGLVLPVASATAQDEQHGIGYSTAIPYEGNTGDALAAAAAGTTIPLTTYSITATKDGNGYSGTYVGGSPSNAAAPSTKISVLIVPLKITIGSTTFDPGAIDSCISPAMSPLQAVKGSPLAKTAAFDGVAAIGHASLVDGVNEGHVTYIDAFRRAEYKTIETKAYHTVFKITYARTFTVTAAQVTAMGGGNVIATGCDSLGVLPFNGFRNFLRGTVLPAISAVNPTTFVLFLTKDVVSTSSTPLNCINGCTIGFHAAFGTPVQTWGVGSYDTTLHFWFKPGITDISVIAHEIAEWLDDPLVTNPTPLWGGIGQVSGCQNNLEVGDPLTGTDFPAITMANGVTYHPQELAFFSWYYNDSTTPSLGAGGKFSMNGTFAGPSKVCPPGGTF